MPFNRHYATLLACGVPKFKKCNTQKTSTDITQDINIQYKYTVCGVKLFAIIYKYLSVNQCDIWMLHWFTNAVVAKSKPVFKVDSLRRTGMPPTDNVSVILTFKPVTFRVQSVCGLLDLWTHDLQRVQSVCGPLDLWTHDFQRVQSVCGPSVLSICASFGSKSCSDAKAIEFRRFLRTSLADRDLWSSQCHHSHMDPLVINWEKFSEIIPFIQEIKKWKNKLVHRCMHRQPNCFMPPAPISGTDINAKAEFNLTKSRFSFVVNPNLDSLANWMVWIRWCCRKWRHCYMFAFIILLFYRFTSEYPSKLDLLDSRIRIRVHALNLIRIRIWIW